MKFIGFNFSKIKIEKFSGSLEGLKINTKIDVSEIKHAKTDFFNKKEELLLVRFNYIIEYNPNYANIELAGEIFLSDEPNNVKEVLKDWEDDKKMSEDFRLFLFNIILRKSNLKALQLEDEMNLPLHLPFPSLKKGDLPQEDTTGSKKDNNPTEDSKDNTEKDSKEESKDNENQEPKEDSKDNKKQDNQKDSKKE